jgi:hypothetical protein
MRTAYTYVNAPALTASAGNKVPARGRGPETALGLGSQQLFKAIVFMETGTVLLVMMPEA